jgi:hypothetical protein
MPACAQRTVDDTAQHAKSTHPGRYGSPAKLDTYGFRFVLAHRDPLHKTAHISTTDLMGDLSVHVTGRSKREGVFSKTPRQVLLLTT